MSPPTGYSNFLQRSFEKKRKETNDVLLIYCLIQLQINMSVTFNVCLFVEDLNEKLCHKTLGQLSTLFYYVIKRFSNYQILHINLPH